MSDLKAAGIKVKKLSRSIVREIVFQLFYDRFVDPDRHGGNFFAEQDKVFFIDFGMSFEVTRENRKLLLDYLNVIGDGNAKDIASAFLEIVKDVDEKKKTEFIDFVERAISETRKEDGSRDSGKLFAEILKYSQREQHDYKEKFLSIFKTLTLLEKYLANVDPGYFQKCVKLAVSLSYARDAWGKTSSFLERLGRGTKDLFKSGWQKLGETLGFAEPAKGEAAPEEVTAAKDASLEGQKAKTPPEGGTAEAPAESDGSAETELTEEQRKRLEATKARIEEAFKESERLKPIMEGREAKPPPGKARQFGSSYINVMAGQIGSAAFWGFWDNDFRDFHESLKHSITPVSMAEFGLFALIQSGETMAINKVLPSYSKTDAVLMKMHPQLQLAIPEKYAFTKYMARHGLALAGAMYLSGLIMQAARSGDLAGTLKHYLSWQTGAQTLASAGSFLLARTPITAWKIYRVGKKGKDVYKGLSFLNKVRRGIKLAEVAAGPGGWALAIGEEIVVFTVAHGIDRVIMPMIDKEFAKKKLNKATESVEAALAAKVESNEDLTKAMEEYSFAVMNYEQSVILRTFTEKQARFSEERTDFTEAAMIAENMAMDLDMEKLIRLQTMPDTLGKRTIDDLTEKEKEKLKIGMTWFYEADHLWRALEHFKQYRETYPDLFAGELAGERYKYERESSMLRASIFNPKDANDYMPHAEIKYKKDLGLFPGDKAWNRAHSNYYHALEAVEAYDYAQNSECSMDFQRALPEVRLIGSNPFPILEKDIPAICFCKRRHLR